MFLRARKPTKRARAELISPPGMAAGAITKETKLLFLDAIFHLAPARSKSHRRELARDLPDWSKHNAD